MSVLRPSVGRCSALLLIGASMMAIFANAAVDSDSFAVVPFVVFAAVGCMVCLIGIVGMVPRGYSLRITDKAVSQTVFGFELWSCFWSKIAGFQTSKFKGVEYIVIVMGVGQSIPISPMYGPPARIRSFLQAGSRWRREQSR